MTTTRIIPIVIGALGLMAPLCASAANTSSVESLDDPLVYPSESHFAQSKTTINVTSPGLRRQTQLTVYKGVRLRIYYAPGAQHFSVITRYKGTTSWFVGSTSDGTVEEYGTKRKAIEAAKDI